MSDSSIRSYLPKIRADIDQLGREYPEVSNILKCAFLVANVESVDPRFYIEVGILESPRGPFEKAWSITEEGQWAMALPQLSELASHRSRHIRQRQAMETERERRRQGLQEQDSLIETLVDDVVTWIDATFPYTNEEWWIINDYAEFEYRLYSTELTIQYRNGLVDRYLALSRRRREYERANADWMRRHCSDARLARVRQHYDEADMAWNKALAAEAIEWTISSREEWEALQPTLLTYKPPNPTPVRLPFLPAGLPPAPRRGR